VQAALSSERLRIRRLRSRDAALRGAAAEPVGLALSGGGIRSATFGLGALQALAEGRLLRRFDYLSTVSGGGYIGAWFSALLYRFHRSSKAPDPISALEALLSPSEIRRKEAEPAELAFLRAYSNYLTPRLGLFSADTLAALMGYARNLLLSLVLALGSVGLGLALLHTLVWGLGQLDTEGRIGAVENVATVLLGIGMLLASSLLVMQRLELPSRVPEGPLRQRILGALRWGQMAYARIMVPMLCAGLMLGGWALESRLTAAHGTALLVPLEAVAQGAGLALVAFAIGAAIAQMVAELAGRLEDDNFLTLALIRLVRLVIGGPNRLMAIVVAGGRESVRYGVAALATGWVAWLLLEVCGALPAVSPLMALFRGPVLVVGVVGVSGVVWLGVVGTTYSELTREWISRLLGSLAGMTLAWASLGLLTVYARPLGVWAATAPWAASIWFGAALVAMALLAGLARLSVSAACGVVSVAFLAGMVVIFQAALATIGAAPARTAPGDWAATLALHLSDIARATHWSDALPAALDSPDPWLRAKAWALAWWPALPVVSMLVLSLAGATLAFRYIDVNVFSLQNLYRNRLVRCYLGAARPEERQQNPYAGFDPADDLALANLARQRPYPLINTALNITHGEELAWQQRKAASFCFTPLRSGYWLETLQALGEPFAPSRRGGYARTAEYAAEPHGDGASRGVMLGTAMATSGAAVSSQMGFASRGMLAFVLTLFNVRLGRWFPNTSRCDDALLKRHSPRYAGAWYLSELLGRTNEKSAWVYLSDGGHFDNLGIYELVRRRCRLVVAVDAGADPQLSFGDLGNCVRKCRVDFGVDIHIDLREFGLAGAGAGSRPVRSHVVGTIDYPAASGDPAFEGQIVYIKSSLPTAPGEPAADIVSFHAENPQFPHQPTSDQWFTEAQFESYRQLGCWLTRQALPEIKGRL
jgi:hypothetical protein